jgi:hypothetical protein
MKKQKMGGREPVQEIVSLNDELFSLVTGDPLAALDEQLAVVAGGITCGSFSCSSYTCGSFTCGMFNI